MSSRPRKRSGRSKRSAAMTSTAWGAAALLLAAVACASAQKPAAAPRLNRWGKPYKEGIAVPAWVARVPDNARGKLALALASHVEVLGIDTATGAASRIATINKEAADVVLRNSRIEATWVDENGEKSEPGGVWTLASLELDSIRGRLRGGAEPASALRGPRSGPAWLDRLPGSATRIYAAGYSGPTYHPEDAARYAGENAVENLAASLRARVQAYTLLVENASGLSVDQFAQTLEDPDEAFRAIVRKNAKIEATWVDAEGARPGDPPGAVWALASIDVQSTKGSVKAVGNDDLGPALDGKGNARPE